MDDLKVKGNAHVVKCGFRERQGTRLVSGQKKKHEKQVAICARSRPFSRNIFFDSVRQQFDVEPLECKWRIAEKFGERGVGKEGWSNAELDLPAGVKKDTLT